MKRLCWKFLKKRKLWPRKKVTKRSCKNVYLLPLEGADEQIVGALELVKGAFMMQDMEGISDSSDEEEPLE